MEVKSVLLSASEPMSTEMFCPTTSPAAYVIENVVAPAAIAADVVEFGSAWMAGHFA